MSQMTIDGKIAIENQWHSWARLTGMTGADAATAQVAVLNAGSKIKRRLGLRTDPFRFRGSAEGIQFQASGLAGSLSLKEVSLEIVPKFVSCSGQLALWNTSALFLLEALAGKHVISLLADRQQWKSHRVVDLIAHAYADAAERGFADRPIHTYRQNEVSSVALRGRLNIARQIRNQVHAPHILECDVDELDAENPFNDVLKWAADTLSTSAVEPALKRRLAEIAQSIPGRVDRSIVHRHHRLLPPPQFQAWSDALELAHLLSSGLTLSSNGGHASGYSLLFNMERAFERFVEVALTRIVQAIAGGELTASRQQSIKYAEASFTGGKDLHCRPDNVVRRKGVPAIIVDAKYKLLDGNLDDLEEATGAPKSQDIYELVAGMFAHDCRAGLLVYPATTLPDSGLCQLRTWNLNVFGTMIRIGALPVNLLSLRTKAGLTELLGIVGQQITDFLGKP